MPNGSVPMNTENLRALASDLTRVPPRSSYAPSARPLFYPSRYENSLPIMGALSTVRVAFGVQAHNDTSDSSNYPR